MFKIKQKIQFDKNNNIIRYEEYQDSRLIYWENNTFNYKNDIISK